VPKLDHENLPDGNRDVRDKHEPLQFVFKSFESEIQILFGHVTGLCVIQRFGLWRRHMPAFCNPFDSFSVLIIQFVRDFRFTPVPSTLKLFRLCLARCLRPGGT
jgi:hypothetical protein